MCSNELLWKIITPNVLYEIATSKKQEDFSPYELKKIEKVVNEIKYVMDSVRYNSDGRFIGGLTSKMRIELRNKSVVAYYENHFVSFTKLEDDYILVKFAKDNLSSEARMVSDRIHDVRFGVMCDYIDGLISFYSDVMTKEDFIKKIMLGDAL